MLSPWWRRDWYLPPCVASVVFLAPSYCCHICPVFCQLRSLRCSVKLGTCTTYYWEPLFFFIFSGVCRYNPPPFWLDWNWYGVALALLKRLQVAQVLLRCTPPLRWHHLQSWGATIITALQECSDYLSGFRGTKNKWGGVVDGGIWSRQEVTQGTIALTLEKYAAAGVLDLRISNKEVLGLIVRYFVCYLGSPSYHSHLRVTTVVAAEITDIVIYLRWRRCRDVNYDIITVLYYGVTLKTATHVWNSKIVPIRERAIMLLACLRLISWWVVPEAKPVFGRRISTFCDIFLFLFLIEWMPLLRGSTYYDARPSGLNMMAQFRF